VLLQLTLQTELKRGVMHLDISASDIITSPAVTVVWLSRIRCWVYWYILVIGQRNSYRHGVHYYRRRCCWWHCIGCNSVKISVHIQLIYRIVIIIIIIIIKQI